MYPSTRDFQDIISKNILPNSPVCWDDIAAAEDIFGHNIGALKGKTVHTPGTRWQSGWWYTSCNQTTSWWCYIVYWHHVHQKDAFLHHQVPSFSFWNSWVHLKSPNFNCQVCPNAHFGNIQMTWTKGHHHQSRPWIWATCGRRTGCSIHLFCTKWPHSRHQEIHTYHQRSCSQLL
jgi:hypothetical protein